MANSIWPDLYVNNFPPLVGEAAQRPAYSTSIAPPMPRLVPLVARGAGSNRTYGQTTLPPGWAVQHPWLVSVRMTHKSSAADGRHREREPARGPPASASVAPNSREPLRRCPRPRRTPPDRQGPGKDEAPVSDRSIRGRWLPPAQAYRRRGPHTSPLEFGARAGIRHAPNKVILPAWLASVSHRLATDAPGAASRIWRPALNTNQTPDRHDARGPRPVFTIAQPRSSGDLPSAKLAQCDRLVDTRS